jgi:transposase InsO family protein
VKFEFISNYQKAFPIGLICKLLKVARSSYYAFLNRRHEPGKRELANKLLLEKISFIFEKNKQRYGSPRIHAVLKQDGESCSLGRIKRLMRKAGLYALSSKKYKPRQEKAEITETKNLLLDESNKATGINQVWHTDIT